MKGIICDCCEDIFFLTKEKKVCKCGRSSGKYVDNRNAIISGYAIPFGIDTNAIPLLKYGYITETNLFRIKLPCHSIKIGIIE